MNLSFGAKTDTGRMRKTNQDGILVCLQGGRKQIGVLVAVADGIGGEAGGGAASAEALRALGHAWRRSRLESIPDALASAVRSANRAVRELSCAGGRYPGAGTTLVTAAVASEAVWVANVGDSRAYLIRSGSCEQITHDHSWSEEVIRAGWMSRAAAERSPHAHKLTRNLGATEHVSLDLFGPLPLVSAERLVLCSDGLYAMISDEEMASLVRSFPASMAAERLVDLANDRGGHDNIAAIVVAVD